MSLRAVHDELEVLLIGPPVSLRELADRLIGPSPATVPLSLAGNAWAYPKRLCSISIETLDASRTGIEVRGACLQIKGPIHQLKAIADNVKQLAANSAESASHMHMEYYDGHPFLEPRSVPLVISRE